MAALKKKATTKAAPKAEEAPKAPVKAVATVVESFDLVNGCSIVARGDGVVVQNIGGTPRTVACKMPVKVQIVEA